MTGIIVTCHKLIIVITYNPSYIDSLFFFFFLYFAFKTFTQGETINQKVGIVSLLIICSRDIKNLPKSKV